MSISHHKSYKHEELEMTFGKNLIVCKFDDLRKARLTGKNRTTAAHSGTLSFMTPELIIEELSIASAGTDKLKTVDI